MVLTVTNRLSRSLYLHWLVNIYSGPLPVAIVFALLPVESTDYIDCSTKFETHELDTFELSVDSVNLPGYPLQKKGYNYNDYYYKFLKETHFFDNPFSPGPMTYDEYKQQNFLVVENLQRYKIYQGDLVAKLKFKGPLPKKLFLYMCPIYQKKLTFDEFLNVTVSDMLVTAADKQNAEIPY